MGVRVVGDLVRHAGPEHEGAAVLKLGVELALEAQDDVPLRAPVVGAVPRAVLDHPDADPAELTRAPVGDAGFTCVLRAFDRFPVGRVERDAGHQHAGYLRVSGLTASARVSTP